MSNVIDIGIEKEIIDKGLTAPRVTVEQIDALMEKVHYWCHRIDDTTTIVATAVLKYDNGETFTLGSESSACASPENFDFDLGEKIACERAERTARDLLWTLEGYSLKKALINE